MELRESGGEGGIRTLGTGVSPYNGLANQSFSPPSLVVKHLQSDPRSPGRTQSLSFGSYCAPLCAPDLRDIRSTPPSSKPLSLGYVSTENLITGPPPTFVPARRSAMMPEPITVATRKRVPRNSAVSLLCRELADIRRKWSHVEDEKANTKSPYCSLAYSAWACFRMGMSATILVGPNEQFTSRQLPVQRINLLRALIP
jgi:hypothetical protein